jgi:hypothetical protein
MYILPKSDLHELSQFMRRLGHSAVMGRKKRDWQDMDYVLTWFDRKKTNVRKAYRQYVQDGIEEGRRVS